MVGVRRGVWCCFFFFKQKTAYEISTRDWSSDVCSSDLKGVVIGDGSGITHLKARCREYAIEDKILFLGYVPFAQLPEYLMLMDVCLSTQSNDLVGQVRT